MDTTVAMITRRVGERVDHLVERVLTMTEPAAAQVLVVAEDPSVAEVTEPVERSPRSWLVRVPAGRGLGYNRNRALDAARGDIIAFLDDDCWPDADWFDELVRTLEDERVDAATGELRIPPSTVLGDAISALGFPGGGSNGFAVMFRVDHEGFTDHISTGNCAFRRTVFERIGGFDETMTAGGEDGELSHRMLSSGMRIKHQPCAIVEHEARTSLVEFVNWFFRRGRAAYQFSRRAPAGPVIRGRLTSYARIIRLHARDAKLLLILPLLGASVAVQQAGFVWEYATRHDGKG